MVMFGGDQFFGGDLFVLDVIGKYFWYFIVGNIFIQQDNVFVMLDFFVQQVVIGVVGGEQQIVDLVGIQLVNELVFFFWVVVGDIQYQVVVVGRSGFFGSVGQFGKEGVGNIGKYQVKCFVVVFVKMVCQVIVVIVQFVNGGFDVVDGVLWQYNIVVYIV